MNSRERFEKEYPTQNGISYNAIGNYYAESQGNDRSSAAIQQFRWQGWQACELELDCEIELLKTESHDKSVRINELKETQDKLIKMIRLLVRDGIIDADLEQQAELLVAKFAGKSEN